MNKRHFTYLVKQLPIALRQSKPNRGVEEAYRFLIWKELQAAIIQVEKAFG